MSKNQNKNLKLQIKTCPTCKRCFHNRKTWESRNMWEKIIYCSTACGKFKDNLNYKSKFKIKQ